MDDPLGVFSQIHSNVLHVEDSQSYIHCNFERIGDEDIHKDLGVMCNNDLTLKSEYAHLSELNLIKYMSYIVFDNHEWTRFILSRVHDEMFWRGNVLVTIDNDLIHKVTGLINEGSNPMNDRNMRNIV